MFKRLMCVVVLGGLVTAFDVSAGAASPASAGTRRGVRT
jgi:hypothetical protein